MYKGEIILTYLYEIYLKNILVIAVIKELIAMAFFAYFFVFRKKKSYYNFYWKGFLLIGIGMSVTPLKILFSIPGKWSLIGLPFLVIGFIWILRGANKQNQDKKRK